MKPKHVIEMKRYGEIGWEFRVHNIAYRTDKRGDGLWQYCNTGSWFADGELEMGWKQIRGLCDFSLPADRKAAYSKIKRAIGVAL